MASKQGKTVKPILFSFGLFVFILITGSLLAYFTPLNQWFSWTLGVSLILALASSIGLYLFIKSKNKPKIDDNTLLINLRKKRLIKHFTRMIKQQCKKKNVLTRYDIPIYLVFSEDITNDKSILSYMGYEAYNADDFGNDIDFPILFWSSENSICISISTGDDQQPEYVEAIKQCLLKCRPRQAVNGALLLTDVLSLQDSNDTLNLMADHYKLTLLSYNEAFGLNIPIYNIMSNMGSIADFCHYFSAFDETKRDDVFGATTPYNKHGGIDAEWFNKEFDHLIQQLTSNISLSMASQLNQEYRNSIAAAPFQFGLIKQNLWRFFKRLYRSEQLIDGLQFRGFYFTHNIRSIEETDLLATVVNESLGNESYPQNEHIGAQQNLFIQNLPTQVFLQERDIVGVNRRKENFLWFTQLSYTCLLFALLVSTIAVIKLDFNYQSEREERAHTLLDRYKEDIANAPYDIENMSDNIPKLYSLQRIYNLYLQDDPWYILPFMPRSTIKDQVESAYLAELNQVLLPSLQNTLEKDLFVYVNLEDQAKTLSLLNNYRTLFNQNRSNIEELNIYFIEALENQGEADASNVAQLKILLHDVFTENMVPIKANYDLQTLAQKVINQTGIDQLLYEHVMELASQNVRIDIRSELGENFNQLFEFTPGYIGYLVPFLYTPTGFNELNLSVDSDLLKEALTAYEGVTGGVPSTAELYRISRELKKNYQNDYIAFWKEFVANVKLKRLTSTTLLNQHLNLVTLNIKNPLYNYYSVISKFTSPVQMKLEADTKPEDVTPVDIEKKESARQIRLSFESIHQQLEPNEQKIAPIDNLITHFNKVKEWLSAYYESNNPQEMAFLQLSATLPAENPIETLANLTSLNQQDKLSKSVTRDIANQTNRLIINLTKEYLNNEWERMVWTPYEQTIQAYYPFTQESDVDADIADVQLFFKSGGTLDSFYQKNLRSFLKDRDLVPYLPGLIRNSGVRISQNVWNMYDKGKNIQKALFINDPQNVSIEFQIKANEMSPTLTEFQISSSKPIFRYRHGPKLWKKELWKGDDIENDVLQFTMKSQQSLIANQDYSGSWNWLRLLQPHITRTNSDTSFAEFSSGESAVTLLIKTRGKINPFKQDFFTGFNLPPKI
ncbi:type VI secretion system membrane subunit TssM [Vibrio sp.]|nr:type VI secretion system membrane subunit TssM [Vibrio sp.]